MGSQVNPPHLLLFNNFLRAQRRASGTTYKIHIQKLDVLVHLAMELENNRM